MIINSEPSENKSKNFGRRINDEKFITYADADTSFGKRMLKRVKSII